MNKLYMHLAGVNIKKNGRMYLPYILSCIFTVQGFYILSFLSQNTALEHMSGGEPLKIILVLGSIVIGMFSVILLFYTNSFLIKRRKREIGLYNILGMEKKHIARVLTNETLICALISIIGGLGLGILLSKLMMMLLEFLLGFSIGFEFYVSIPSLVITAVLFLLIFMLNLLFNLRQIHLAKPIELLKGSSTGEKEPKAKWLLAVLGVLCLAAGYTIAIITEKPVDALGLFFVAVILVIIGTYLLFTAGSIALLKALRANKGYYYKPRHFVAVSGMLYRMKQNAVGLANICVLSTMVLVMLSGTLSLNLGFEDSLRAMYPRNINFTGRGNVQVSAVKADIDALLEQNGLTAVNPVMYRYRFLNAPILLDGEHFSKDNNGSLCIVTAQEYAACTGVKPVLAKNQVLAATSDTLRNSDDFTASEVSVGNLIFEVMGQFDAPAPQRTLTSIYGAVFIVISDESVLTDIYANLGYESGLDQNGQPTIMAPKLYIGFDLNAPDAMQMTMANDIAVMLFDKWESAGFFLSYAAAMKESFLSIYGGLFFLGIFLGLLFIMATVLIIYYKQLNEAYDDRQRYEILQKVGMSKRDIRSAINSQVLTMFFLPLIFAAVHVAFAFKMITRLLSLLNLFNEGLFLICTLCTVAVFALLYIAVYWICARICMRPQS